MSSNAPIIMFRGILRWLRAWRWQICVRKFESVGFTTRFFFLILSWKCRLIKFPPTHNLKENAKMADLQEIADTFNRIYRENFRPSKVCKGNPSHCDWINRRRFPDVSCFMPCSFREWIESYFSVEITESAGVALLLKHLVNEATVQLFLWIVSS